MIPVLLFLKKTKIKTGMVINDIYFNKWYFISMRDRFDDFNFWLEMLMPNSEAIESYVEEAKNVDRLSGSKQIIPILRDTIEYIMNCIAINDGCVYVNPNTHQSVNVQSIKFIKGKRNKYEDLVSLHDSIQKSSGHESCLVGDYAERLMLHHFPKLIRIKDYFYKRFGIRLFKNLTQFPLKLDSSLKDYYSKVVDVLKDNSQHRKAFVFEKYYVLDKKEKYVNNHSFFEYTLAVIDDNRNKADKIIAYSNIDIFSKYAMEIKSYDESIDVLGVRTSVKIIVDYSIRIRICEFRKLADILGIDGRGFSKTKEYFDLMSFIKDYRLSLADIVRFEKQRFERFSAKLFGDNSRTTILNSILSKARSIFHTNNKGNNVLIYLLASMENKTLEKQKYYPGQKQMQFTDLLLTSKAIPFDKTPFCANLYGGYVDSDILFSTFDVSEHEHELVKREIDIYCQTNGLIYCPLSMFDNDPNLFNKIHKLNSINGNFEPFFIDVYYDDNNDGFVYLKQNESDAVSLFNIIFDYLSKESIVDYRNYCESQLSSKGLVIEDPLKDAAVKRMFDRRSIFAVYGPAGTGKSYVSKIVLDVLDTYKVLCISSTHASLQNIKRRIGANRAEYSTVERATKTSETSLKKFDLIIFDECSTISNSDMLTIMKRISPKLILLLGDVYQIQSIDLGNWFGLLDRLIPNEAKEHLNNCYRTTKTVISHFWTMVRNIEPNIASYMKNYDITHELSNSFFDIKHDDNRIVLCLNYGGIYGINSINKLMQCKNHGKSVAFRDHIYKVGDPILFKDIQYFSDIFYNNLKGQITNIDEDDDKVIFSVLIKDNINIAAFDKRVFNVSHISGNTQLSFAVLKSNDSDIDGDFIPSKIIPFNVAYAVSIHKAQGLEFNDVDIVISSEVKDVVTHNIFYTAITRAIDNLNIYWSPECESAIIDNMKERNYLCDEAILLQKYEVLRKYR